MTSSAIFSGLPPLQQNELLEPFSVLPKTFKKEAVYWESNETADSRKRSCEILSKMPQPPNVNRAIMGVSGWHIYRLAFAVKATVMIIFDANPAVIYLHQETEKAILKSKNREEFIDKITWTVHEVMDIAESGQNWKKILKFVSEFGPFDSWLSSEENFLYILDSFLRPVTKEKSKFFGTRIFSKS
jgi:hypothetical protein